MKSNITAKHIVIIAGLLLLVTPVLYWLSFIPLESVKETYKSRSEAEENKLFERGWLPSIIPESAHNIFIDNNLDINTSRGKFQFSPEEANRFINAISGESKKKLGTNGRIKQLKQQGYTDHHYEQDKTTWRFLIKQDEGRCEYWAR